MGVATTELIGQPETEKVSAQPTFMYFGYIDDSGSTGNKLDDPQSRFQVIGGPIIEGETYARLEWNLTQDIEQLVPEEMWDSFEFHACDLFLRKPPYDKARAKPGQSTNRYCA